MGESDRYHKLDKQPPRKIKFLLGADNNAIVGLFSINTVFILVLLTIQVGFFVGGRSATDFYNTIVKWVEMPANLLTFSGRPWTILTYMFADAQYSANMAGGIFRALSNMIWLWAFGYILQQIAGNSKLIPIYIYGGLLGAIFFFIANYAIPPIAAVRDSAGLLGANAGVMAIAIATTVLAPEHRFFTQIRNGIPIWVLTGIYVLIDIAGVASSNAAYSLSHIGGAIAGFLFVYFLRKGYDGSLWMNKLYHYLMHMFDPKEKKENNDSNNKLYYETGNRQPFTKESNLTQKRLDEILDKINQQGFSFLTEEEKSFLKKASNSKEI
jgi:membrane associated rhomboid family serine protease